MDLDERGPAWNAGSMIDSIKITDQLIAVTVVGTVDKDDWAKLADIVDDALKQYDSLSIYADLTHLDSMTGGAIYEDAKVGIKNLGNLDHLDRVAVVTDKTSMEKTIEVSQKLLPGVEVQVFSSNGAAEAYDWAATAG